MAKRTVPWIVCDRHRHDVDAVGTLEIAIDDIRVQLDLCAEHLAAARRDFRPLLRAADAASKGKGKVQATAVSPATRRRTKATSRA